MNVDAASTVETQVQTPVQAPIDPPASEAPEARQPEPQSKGPTLRESVESSLKGLRERARDEGGRFTQSKAPEPQLPVEQPKPAKIERPANMPKAWGADKASIWTGLSPEAVAHISEREAAMEAFHAKHAGLGEWQKAAEANGTTLNDVLQRVSVVENALLQDPSQGLIQACQMVGMERGGAIQALTGALRALGVNVGGGGQQQPPQQQGQPQQPQTELRDPRVDEVLTKLSTIESTFGKQAEDRALQAVEAFRADTNNKYFDQVADDVIRELQAMRALGKQPDLKLAYERACWGRADIREKLVAEQVASKTSAQTAAQTQVLEKSRSASRSVAGSPPQVEGRSSADRPSKLRDQVAQGVRSAMAGRV